MSYGQRQIYKVAQAHENRHHNTRSSGRNKDRYEPEIPQLATEVYNSLLKHIGDLHIAQLFYSAEDKKMIVHFTNEEKMSFDVWPKKVTKSPIDFQKTWSYTKMGNPCQHNSKLPCQLCTKKSGIFTKQCNAKCIDGHRCRRERTSDQKYCWQHQRS